MRQPEGEVVLAGARPASSLLHDALRDCVDAYPELRRGADLPQDPKRFRDAYPQVLPAFEAARLDSPARVTIARQLVGTIARQVLWQSEGQGLPLDEALGERVDPLPLEHHDFPEAPGFEPAVVYRGERFGAAQLRELGGRLLERGVVSAGAEAALDWLEATQLDEGRIRLPGRKIAVLGGGAEMAPTRFWLEAGAEVLWIDVAPPPAEWREAATLGGRLCWPAGNADLLEQPQAVLATLLAFADGEPLDLGLYAYAPGRARELRLTGVMNAIVEALPGELVRSVTMLVSPTTPTALDAEDITAMDNRLARRPGWEALLAGLGLLGRGGGRATVGAAAVPRSVVAIQGLSYQAAQYVGKVLTAECWAAEGPVAGTDQGPLRVSANTAAITRTRSLDHPVFAAAFGGAAAFGVETFTPRQSRRVNGLLALADWLAPDSPMPGKVRVHGGIHTLPYPLDRALRVAAAIGFARAPRLLRGLLKR